MSKRTSGTGQVLIGVALIMCLACGAQAALLNPGFEAGNLTSWTLVSSGGYGSGGGVTDNVANQLVQYPTFSNPLPGTAEGTYYASIRGYGTDPALSTYLYQNVGALLPNTIYTLTIAIGVGRFDSSPPDGFISLINGTDHTGTVLDSGDVNTLGMGQYANNFKDLTATFTTGASVTGDLVISIETIGGFSGVSSMRLDNVRLTTETIPEPASLALLSLGGFLIQWRRRRY